MARQVKVVVINPHTQSITEEVMGTSLQDIYAKIDATCFDLVHLRPSCVMFVDDTGLYRPEQKFFSIAPRAYAKPLTIGGIAVVTGADAMGETCDVPSGIYQTLLTEVTWLKVRFVGMASDVRQHGNVTFFNNVPKFEEVE